MQFFIQNRYVRTDSKNSQISDPSVTENIPFASCDQNQPLIQVIDLEEISSDFETSSPSHHIEHLQKCVSKRTRLGKSKSNFHNKQKYFSPIPNNNTSALILRKKRTNSVIVLNSGRTSYNTACSSGYFNSEAGVKTEHSNESVIKYAVQSMEMPKTQNTDSPFYNEL